MRSHFFAVAVVAATTIAVPAVAFDQKLSNRLAADLSQKLGKCTTTACKRQAVAETRETIKGKPDYKPLDRELANADRVMKKFDNNGSIKNIQKLNKQMEKSIGKINGNRHSEINAFALSFSQLGHSFPVAD